jgi:hypothetical protein
MLARVLLKPMEPAIARDHPLSLLLLPLLLLLLLVLLLLVSVFAGHK